MQTNNLPVEHNNLSVIPRPIELVFADDGLSPLTLILPPLEDLAEIGTLRTNQFSLKEFAANEWGKLSPIFESELNALESKDSRFSDAPTFLNRLANLAELAGDRGRESQYLLRMRSLVNDEFVAHRLGENLIARNLNQEAEELFSKLNLKQDAHANLRLAFFHVQRRDFDAAFASVSRAVSINPLDFGARLFEGSLHLVRGEHELAIQSFRFASEDRQTSSPLFTNLALAHIYVGKPEKAFAALRKAVALDPSNENAIALLADLAFSKNRNEDAIPSLRYFLLYEQKNSSMWARLARALLEIGETNEAIAALKRQASIENTSFVWNNLGVAYHRRKDRKKAYEAFKHAMKLEVDSPSRNFFLAARNLTSLLADEGAYKEILSFSNAVFSDDRHHTILKDRQLADMYIFHVHALARTGAKKEAVHISESLLSLKRSELSPKLAAWLVTSLITHYSLEEESGQISLELIRRYKDLLDELRPEDIQIKNMMINNIAFAYLESGQIDNAEQYLNRLTQVFHKDPFATATLGLFHMRRGNMDRAAGLYEEAVHLAADSEDKKRIRQKLSYELGLHYLGIDSSRAKRYLQKAAEQRESLPQLAKRALSLLKKLN